MNIQNKLTIFVIGFILITMINSCNRIKIDRENRVFYLMELELKESLSSTHLIIKDEYTKTILLKIDSTLLNIVSKAFEESENININYDLPIYYIFYQSSPNPGDFAIELFNYLDSFNIKVKNFDGVELDSVNLFYEFLMTKKLSVLEFYIYISNIRNQIKVAAQDDSCKEKKLTTK